MATLQYPKQHEMQKYTLQRFGQDSAELHHEKSAVPSLFQVHQQGKPSLAYSADYDYVRLVVADSSHSSIFERGPTINSCEMNLRRHSTAASCNFESSVEADSIIGKCLGFDLGIWLL